MKMERITVLDTETTGQDIDEHEIIEIAWKVYENRNGRWFCYRYGEYKTTPQHIETADPEALEINGYTEFGWKDSVHLSRVLLEMIEDIENSDLLVGHNLIFDLFFIVKHCKIFGFDIPNFPKYIDTRYEGEQLKKLGKLEKSPNLRRLCEHYEVEVEGREHTALVDCDRTFEVYRNLEDDLERLSMWTYDNPYDFNSFAKHKP